MVGRSVVVFFAFALVDVIVATVGESEFFGAVTGPTFPGDVSRPSLGTGRLPFAQSTGKLGRAFAFKAAIVVGIDAFAAIQTGIIGTLFRAMRPEKSLFANAIHRIPILDAIRVFGAGKGRTLRRRVASFLDNADRG